MDVDAEEQTERGLKPQTIFAKSEELEVSLFAHLPSEVKLALKNAGTCIAHAKPRLCPSC